LCRAVSAEELAASSLLFGAVTGFFFFYCRT
jgi:hypothetical protein